MQPKNSVKLDIRPLEAKGLFTIRHVNSSVESYVIPQPASAGKIVIIMDIDTGVLQNQKQSPEEPILITRPKNAIDLPLIYNENIIKSSPLANGATEVTLKFVVPGQNIFYSNGEMDDNSSAGFKKIKQISNGDFSRDDLTGGKGTGPSVVLSENISRE